VNTSLIGSSICGNFFINVSPVIELEETIGGKAKDSITTSNINKGIQIEFFLLSNKTLLFIKDLKKVF
jgi:hypothetical protein